MNQMSIEEQSKDLLLWNTAIIRPNLPQLGIDSINELVKYKILEKVDNGNRIKFIDAFEHTFKTVDIEAIIKSWGSGDEESFSQTDWIIIKLKHMEAVVTKYLKELGIEATKEKLHYLGMEADSWLHWIEVANAFRMQELERDR